MASHRGQVARSQEVERQVNGASAAVTRLGGQISLLEHLGSIDVRIVAQLLRPSSGCSHQRTSNPRLVGGDTQPWTRPKPSDAASSRALSRAAHKARKPRSDLRYPSTGLPVKLSRVAYFASHRIPQTRLYTKANSAWMVMSD